MIQSNKPMIAFLLALLSTVRAHAGELPIASLEVDGQQRIYHLFKPSNCDRQRPLPLLMAFHGGGGKAAGFARYTGLNKIAARECFLVVYPQGLNQHWHDARFTEMEPRVNDPGFINALLTRMLAEHNADPKRVYLTGMSNGGVFALQLAVTIPLKVAAVATVTAQLPANLPVPSVGSRLPSLLMINGTEDPIMPYQGGEVSFKRFGKSKSRGNGSVQSTQATLAFWRSRNGLDKKAIRDATRDKRLLDGTRVNGYEWKDENSTVKLLEVVGGGHTWPGKGQYLPRKIIGRTSREIDASETIWNFLKDKRLQEQ